MKKNIYFVGIGSSRSMHNWLLNCLREHPELNVPKYEIHFFNKTFNGKSTYDVEGITGYYKRFENIDGKHGEISPNYFQDAETPKIIKKHFKNIKIIIILRNPFEVYRSCKVHTEQFEELDLKEQDYIDKGLYYKKLKRYLDIFPRKNILIMLCDDLDDNRKGTIKKIYSFLKVDKIFEPDSLYKRVNSTSKPKYNFLMNYRRSFSKMIEFMKENNLNFIISMFRWTKLNWISWYIWEKNRIPIERKELSKEKKQELSKIYISDINLTEKLIKRDLSIWKK